MKPTLTTTGAIVLLLVSACGPSRTAELEANKALVRRFTEVVNAADWERLDELVAEDFTRHSVATAGPLVTSRQAFVDLQESFLATFPDQRVTLRQLVAEGDRVAVLATFNGTQTGPMGDFPATGESVEMPFLGLFRIQEGRIVEMWVEWDNLAMLTRLGLLPPPG